MRAIGRRALDCLLERHIDTLQTVELLGIYLEHLALDELVGIWTLAWINAEHKLHYGPDVIRVVLGDPWKYSLANSLVEMVHVATTERWFER